VLKEVTDGRVPESGIIRPGFWRLREFQVAVIADGHHGGGQLRSVVRSATMARSRASATSILEERDRAAGGCPFDRKQKNGTGIKHVRFSGIDVILLHVMET